MPTEEHRRGQEGALSNHATHEVEYDLWLHPGNLVRWSVPLLWSSRLLPPRAAALAEASMARLERSRIPAAAVLIGAGMGAFD